MKALPLFFGIPAGDRVCPRSHQLPGDVLLLAVGNPSMSILDHSTFSFEMFIWKAELHTYALYKVSDWSSVYWLATPNAKNNQGWGSQSQDPEVHLGLSRGW